MKVTVDGHNYEVERGRDQVTVDHAIYRIRVETNGPARTVYVNDFPYHVDLPDDYTANSTLIATVDGRMHTVEIEGKIRAAAPPPPRRAAHKQGPLPTGGIPSAMAGRIVSIAVEAGQTVTAGQVLLVLEAMKMKNEIVSPKDGVIKSIEVAAGTRVNAGDVLIIIEHRASK